MDVLSSIQMGEIVALGWTLLHFCWQTTAIALIYALVDRCASRTAAPVRYGIAMAALTLMVMAAGATFVVQERSAIPAAQSLQQSVVSPLDPLPAAVASELPSAARGIGVGMGMDDPGRWIAAHVNPLMPWIDGLWLGGVLLLSLRAAGGWWQLQSVRRRAMTLAPREVVRSFEGLVDRLRMTRRIALRISSEVVSPLVMGVWHITVIVPLSAVLSLAPEQLEAVLAHELAHVRRWDYLCNLIQTAVECLFFFHPAVWWVSRRAREFREVCCDEVAAKVCADPAIYAEALLQLEEQRARHLQLAVALHGDGGTLLNRIRRVMGEKAMEKRTISGVRIAVAAMVLSCLYVAPHVAQGLAQGSRMQATASQSANLPANASQQPVPVPPAAPVAEDPGPTTGEIAPVEPPVPAAPASAPTPRALIAVAHPAPAPSPKMQPMPTDDNEPKQSGTQFMEGMRAAGYTLDLNKDLEVLVSLRSVGVTSDYAKAMAQVGLGTPTLRELVSLKAVGVTPEYVAALKATAAAPSNFRDVISEKSLGITPEYARSVAAMNLGSPAIHDLVSLKSMGITPEYVAALKAGGIVPENLHEVVGLKSVGVTPEYAKSMAAAGVTGLGIHDLISLKAMGVTPESIKWLKATFPEADLREIRQATAFHIDAAFVANAKAHGFNGTSLDKLTKLKMSGLLD